MKIRAKPRNLNPLSHQILTTANGKYKNVFARIYPNSAGKENCRISELKKVKGVFKRRKLKIFDLVHESFEGSCVIKVYQVYVGTNKTITLSVEEIMATNMAAKKSYFDEYEEMVSDDSLPED